MSWPDAAIAVLVDCPPEALVFAAAAYQAGVADGVTQGRQAAEDEMAARWAAAAAAVRAVTRLPTGEQLRRVRAEAGCAA